MDKRQKNTQRFVSILNIAAAVATIVASILTIVVVLGSVPTSDNQTTPIPEPAVRIEGNK